MRNYVIYPLPPAMLAFFLKNVVVMISNNYHNYVCFCGLNMYLLSQGKLKSSIEPCINQHGCLILYVNRQNGYCKRGQWQAFPTQFDTILITISSNPIVCGFTANFPWKCLIGSHLSEPSRLRISSADLKFRLY